MIQSHRVGLLVGGVALVIAVMASFATHSFDYPNKHVVITGGSSGIGIHSYHAYYFLLE